MSWDLSVRDFRSDAKKVTDIPEGFRSSLIGKRAEIIDGIIDVFPSAVFSNPSWGLIIGQDWSIEVNLGSEEECRHFVLRVRGEDAAIAAVAAILERLNLRAIDCQTSEFFVPDDSALESFRKWRKYRYDVVRSTNPI